MPSLYLSHIKNNQKCHHSINNTARQCQISQNLLLTGLLNIMHLQFFFLSYKKSSMYHPGVVLNVQIIAFSCSCIVSIHYSQNLTKIDDLSSNSVFLQKRHERRIKMNYLYNKYPHHNIFNILEKPSFKWMLKDPYSLLNRCCDKCIIIISKLALAKKASERMFYYTPTTTFGPTNNLVYYFMSNGYGFSQPQTAYYSPQPAFLTPTYTTHTPFSECPQAIPVLETKATLKSLKSEISETIQGASESRTMEKLPVETMRPTYKKCQKLGIQEIKLDFRIQWKNQNRNIVPNLVNQMMSFLLKKNKSQRLIAKLMDYYPHSSSWTAGKFYLYMKKIKDSISHYVNESVIQYFFQVHEPKCEIYEEEEQQFYMKLCRIAIVTFLRNDAIIISLTSTRMSEAKRKTHLIARDALLRKFMQLAQHRHY